eukprot:RCo039575
MAASDTSGTGSAPQAQELSEVERGLRELAALLASPCPDEEVVRRKFRFLLELVPEPADVPLTTQSAPGCHPVVQRQGANVHSPGDVSQISKESVSVLVYEPVLGCDAVEPQPLKKQEVSSCSPCAYENDDSDLMNGAETPDQEESGDDQEDEVLQVQDPQDEAVEDKPSEFLSLRKKLLENPDEEVASENVTEYLRIIMHGKVHAYQLYGRHLHELMKLGARLANRTLLEVKYDPVARAVAQRALKLVTMMLATH